jgi:hypothetical protein
MNLEEFDRLQAMYNEDQELFEIEKQRILDEYVDSLPEEKKQTAQQLLWKTNGKLAKIKNPVERFNQSVSMMYESVAELSTALDAFLNDFTYFNIEEGKLDKK